MRTCDPDPIFTGKCRIHISEGGVRRAAGIDELDAELCSYDVHLCRDEQGSIDLYVIIYDEEGNVISEGVTPKPKKAHVPYKTAKVTYGYTMGNLIYLSSSRVKTIEGAYDEAQAKRNKLLLAQHAAKLASKGIEQSVATSIDLQREIASVSRAIVGKMLREEPVAELEAKREGLLKQLREVLVKVHVVNLPKFVESED